MEFLLGSLASALILIFDFDSSVFVVVWTSIRISLIAVILASLFSVPMGLLVALSTFPGKPLLLQTLNTLVALPTVVVGLLLYGILSRQGPMGELGLLYTPTAMIIGQCVLIIPVIWSLSISAALSADPRLLMTCRGLGANTIQQGLLFLNEVRFLIMAAVVMGFGRAIGEVGIAMMLGGNIEGFTRTMTTAIALETSKGEFEFALALGILLLLVAFVINGLLQRFQYLNK
ncbi:MAG: tungstate transport system permease protein [Gammaproteobacteria bacterium]|jgi:tungstate transport system permease protein